MSESETINLGDRSTSSQSRRPLSPADRTVIDITNAENDALHHSESSLSSKMERIKWTLLFSSFIVEGLSSAFDQLSVPQKPIYALMAVLMASLSLIASIIELYYRVQERNKIVRRLLGDALANFGFFASTWQCIYSTIEYNCIKNKLNNPIKMSFLPLIFLICVAISRLWGVQISLRRRSHSRGESESSSMEALLRADVSFCISNASDNEETEWVEQEDGPGVHLTIRRLVNGARELLRVRFSNPSRNFLSSCYACQKNLRLGKDIYMYRGEKAFCSPECRYQEVLLEGRDMLNGLLLETSVSYNSVVK